jgi:hypothetical protein
MVGLTSVLPGLVFLSGALDYTTHGWEKVASGAVVLACVLFGVRVARLGMFAGPEQLVVRDYFRTYRIRWTEIASFEPPPPYETLRKAGLRIRLVDGHVISATLYARNGLDTGSRATLDAVQKLNRLLAERAPRGQSERLSEPGE